MAKTTANAADYIEPLNMNGLQGRMLRLPAAKAGDTRELLIIYGHHAKLERWWGLVQNFNAFGTVTMPDLPGFGGMDSFYRIGQKPTIDNLADYLASFIKLRYKRRRLTIVGISFGFVIVTRMLQRYPEIAGKVDLAVSMMGFMHKDDFSLSQRTMWLYRATSRTLSLPVMRQLIRLCYVNPWAINAGYGHVRKVRQKRMGTADHEAELIKRMMEIELELWRANDFRTHMVTSNAFLRVDNTKQPIGVSVFHIGTEGDFYFNHIMVEQHMRRVFKTFNGAILKLAQHTPSVLANKAETAPFVPPKLRRLLDKSPKRA